jgi:hypothetical protein
MIPGTPIVPVPLPVDPIKQRLMNPDAIFAFAVGTVALIATTFTNDPHIQLVCGLLGGELTIIGGVLHLDGK